MNAAMRADALRVLRVVHILEVFEEASRVPARARRVPSAASYPFLYDGAGRPDGMAPIDLARPAKWRRP